MKSNLSLLYLYSLVLSAEALPMGAEKPAERREVAERQLPGLGRSGGFPGIPSLPTPSGGLGGFPFPFPTDLPGLGGSGGGFPGFPFPTPSPGGFPFPFPTDLPGLGGSGGSGGGFPFPLPTGFPGLGGSGGMSGFPGIPGLGGSGGSGFERREVAERQLPGLEGSGGFPGIPSLPTPSGGLGGFPFPFPTDLPGLGGSGGSGGFPFPIPTGFPGLGGSGGGLPFPIPTGFPGMGGSGGGLPFPIPTGLPGSGGSGGGFPFPIPTGGFPGFPFPTPTGGFPGFPFPTPTGGFPGFPFPTPTGGFPGFPTPTPTPSPSPSPSPSPLGSELHVRADASTRNDLKEGQCQPLTVIFARGTTEPGNVGTVVGPPFFNALEKAHGSKIAVQGVDYPADVPGYMAGGSKEGAQTMADLVTEAAAKCPDTMIVLSGYSQGSQVAHLAAKQLGDAQLQKVSSVVLFGDPLNKEPIKGVDQSKVKIFCAEGDSICDGQPVITPAHLSYGDDAEEAAKFVMQSMGM